uniref:Uncharacterized protein n=1 Tax=Anguilla anguilla TaxID=7936 RepID=A0A0E9QZG6_ANGAN
MTQPSSSSRLVTVPSINVTLQQKIHVQQITSYCTN